MIVRCTAKMLKLLDVRPTNLAAIEPAPDDWYLNLLWFDRRKCLLAVHAETLFAAFVPDVRKRDLDPLAPLLAGAITQALEAEGLPSHTLGPLDAEAQIAKTASRQVLGWMNQITYHLERLVWDSGNVMDVDTITITRRLQRDIHLDGNSYIRPIDRARDRVNRTPS